MLRGTFPRRNQIVRQRSRLKNIIQSILHSHLIPSCPHQDLCGPRGRAWLAEQVVPEDERLAIERHLREFDRLGEDLKVIERDLARSALADEGVKRLMTIPGVDMVVALAMSAAIGDSRGLTKPRSLSAISVSTRASASRDRGRRTMDGLPSRAAVTHAACWWRQPGRRRERLVRCEPSFCGSEPDAASTWRRWRPRASSPS